MNSISILHIGRNSGTSRDRVFALRRLGHQVFSIDPYAALPKNRLSGMWMWKAGGLFLEGYIARHVLQGVPNTDFNLVFVDGGAAVGPCLVRELKGRFGTVINYSIDDPFGQRDGRRWRIFQKAVPLYSLIAVVRECNVAEAFRAGARKVIRVHRSADEVTHAPSPLSAQEHSQWASDVLFVGTWMPERGPFLASLVQAGVPLSIYGNLWQKALEWPVLRSVWRGGSIDGGDYARAIQSAKVCLGLVSKGNRDLSTTRSFEIPHLGGVLCAERTTDHTQLYREGEEAVFWSSVEECADKCRELLGDQTLRKSIALRGRLRCLENRTTNEEVLARILGEALKSDESRNDGKHFDVRSEAFGGQVLASSNSFT